MSISEGEKFLCDKKTKKKKNGLLLQFTLLFEGNFLRFLIKVSFGFGLSLHFLVLKVSRLRDFLLFTLRVERYREVKVGTVKFLRTSNLLQT